MSEGNSVKDMEMFSERQINNLMVTKIPEGWLYRSVASPSAPSVFVREKKDHVHPAAVSGKIIEKANMIIEKVHKLATRNDDGLTSAGIRSILIADINGAAHQIKELA